MALLPLMIILPGSASRGLTACAVLGFDDENDDGESDGGDHWVGSGPEHITLLGLISWHCVVCGAGFRFPARFAA